MRQLTFHYFDSYRSLKLTRDNQGVLPQAGPLIFTAQDHTDFVDAFYRIAQDQRTRS
jgi:hypothetical protein